MIEHDFVYMYDASKRYGAGISQNMTLHNSDHQLPWKPSMMATKQ